MDEDICVEDEVSCMVVDAKKKGSADEQLAALMHRFNLDWDTVEQMPAFDAHRDCLVPPSIKKVVEE